MKRVNNHTGNSQNYNRFSYALNNPLKYTDPSGYSYKPDDWNSSPVIISTFGMWDIEGGGGGGGGHFPWYLQYNSPEFN